MPLRNVLISAAITFISPLATADDLIAAAQVEVREVLAKAGDNRLELEKVIRHYGNSDDSIKLAAVNFLIANMDGHGYVVFALFDEAGTEIAFDNARYINYESLLVAWDQLELSHPGLDFKKKILVDDVDTITADFLIENIDLAFRAWSEKPWARNLSFDDFCDYVLPYRGSNEPLESWRQYFLDKYNGLPLQMTNPNDAMEAARIINTDVMTYFKFDPRYYYHPTDQGLAEMLSAHFGRCEDMTNITIYAMRANGLAVTSDYTPYWANSGNNHAWNAILTAQGQVVPFMGAEANPGEYSLWNKLAKVYRKMYSKQPENLIFQSRKQEKVPAWLAGKSYRDVTSDYVKTSEVRLTLEIPPPDTVDVAYICVFNDGQWKPIHWGRIDNGAVSFTDMGMGISYLPAYYVTEDSLECAGSPFILEDGGNRAILKGLSGDSISAKLFSTTTKVQQTSTDGVQNVFFTAGQWYELFYWSGSWQSLGRRIANGGPLIFEKIPSGRLYWLVADSSDRDERIFTIVDGKQVWW
jgi:hypothetical protein